MPVNLDASDQFIWANARLLDRHRLAVLGHGGPVEPVLQTLRAYRNADGGFGHALEPDVRGPHSETAATLHALLAEVGALGDPMVSDAAAWVGSVAGADGRLPFVLPAAVGYPLAPWMGPSPEGSFLTFAIAARLYEAGVASPWLARATEWCWARLQSPDDLTGYWVKFALDFLDHVPAQERATAAIGKLGAQLRPDGTLPVPDGIENEQITPLALSPRPGRRSRALFSNAQIERDLDLLEREQQDDGGWTFDWLGWSQGQSTEWRGIMTLRALGTLAAHDRIPPPAGN